MPWAAGPSWAQPRSLVSDHASAQVPACILHQDTESYALPDKYIPERWLPDVRPEAVARVTGALLGHVRCLAAHTSHDQQQRAGHAAGQTACRLCAMTPVPAELEHSWDCVHRPRLWWFGMDGHAAGCM